MLFAYERPLCANSGRSYRRNNAHSDVWSNDRRPPPSLMTVPAATGGNSSRDGYSAPAHYCFRKAERRRRRGTKLMRLGRPPQCCHLDRARMRQSSWVRIACAVSALRCRSCRKPANISTDAHRAVYFAMPDPFELLPCWSNGLTGTLPCEARACWLSLPARIFRSLVRPLTSRSENSRASIDEIARVSDGGINQRLQARRIKRKNTRGFLILRPTRKPPYERSVRRVSQDRSSADCL